jgi:hypothetical protein
MKLISDVIRELQEIQESLGDVEVMVEGFQTEDNDGHPLACPPVLVERTVEGATGVDESGNPVEGDNPIVVVLPHDHPNAVEKRDPDA